MENQDEKQTTEIKMDGKSKMLFVVIGILIVGSIAVTYWRYMMKRDYIIQAQKDCDPTTENCFVWKCDPNATDETEQCTGDPEKDIWYYKIIRRNAKNIPDCDPADENCTALQCDTGEKDCAEELCSAQNIPKGEECNDPVQYNIDNPPEEDASGDSSAVECNPDEEDCPAANDTAQCDLNDQACIDAAGNPADTPGAVLPSPSQDSNVDAAQN